MALFGLQAALNYSLRDSYPPAQWGKDEQTNRWNAELFRKVTLGHLPAALDWMWIQVLMDTRIDHVSYGNHPQIFYQLDLLADLDPENLDAYTKGANLLAVIRNDGLGAESILKRGESFRVSSLASYPEKFRNGLWRDSWSVPLLLAYDELFELGSLPKAAEAFRSAAQVPGSPPYLQSLAKRLENPGGEYEVGLRLLNFMISNNSDEKTRKELSAKRNSLFIGQYVFDLNHEFGKYLRVSPKSKASSEWFHRFLRENRIREVDPWGGILSLSSDGKIVTSTAHQKVFGLD